MCAEGAEEGDLNEILILPHLPSCPYTSHTQTDGIQRFSRKRGDARGHYNIRDRSIKCFPRLFFHLVIYHFISFWIRVKEKYLSLSYLILCYGHSISALMKLFTWDECGMVPPLASTETQLSVLSRDDGRTVQCSEGIDRPLHSIYTQQTKAGWVMYLSTHPFIHLCICWTKASFHALYAQCMMFHSLGKYIIVEENIRMEYIIEEKGKTNNFKFSQRTFCWSFGRFSWIIFFVVQ